MVRVLFVEPFYGGSHRAFLDGLVRHSQHTIDLLTQPGGEWRRRMRRGSQELAREASDSTAHYDVLLVSDMLDLAAFLALTRPRFDRLPVLAYFHENQFTYPRLRGTKLNSWFGQVNYLTALVADAVAFNSAFHRDDFLTALQTIAGHPNNWLEPASIDEIAAKSSLLPVGIDLAALDGHRLPKDTSPPLILWNHRWDFDKAPDVFVTALEHLAEEGLDFAVAIAGEPGDNPSQALVEAPTRLGGRLVHHGFASSFEDYARLLWRSSIAVSTSRQEFFGVATVEAMYCGCIPVLPARLNYPHLVPGDWHAATLWTDLVSLEERLRALITAPPAATTALRDAVAEYDWAHAAPTWDAAIDRLAALR